MPRLEQQQIELARTRMSDALNIMSGAGYTVERVGAAEYSLKEHDSMRINVDKNCFIRNSDGTRGDPIELLKEYCGLTFPEAVKQLTPEYTDTQTRIQVSAEKRIQNRQSTAQSKAAPKSEKDVYTLSDNCKRAAAYLQQTRGIDGSIVSALIKSGKIRQDERGNVVFRIFDEKGDWKGAERRGTFTYGDKPAYKNCTSETGYGFTISVGTPNKVCFFESAIDTISYYDLHKDNLKDVSLVSLAGVTKTKTLHETVERMKAQYGIENKDIWLCVDRDRAGQDLIKSCREEYNGCKAYLTPDPNCKDWNELLITVRDKEHKQSRPEQHIYQGWIDLCDRDKRQDISDTKGNTNHVSHSSQLHEDR